MSFSALELNHPGTPLSPATDTYALGQTWCQLLASSPSGRAADEPLSWADSLPAELGQLLEAMVADDPQVRPRDLIDVAQKIQPYLSAVGQEIPEAVPSAAQLTFERSLGRTSEPSPVAPPPLLPEELDQPPSALLPAQAVQDPRHDPNPDAVFEAKQAANVTPQISTELEVVTPARSGRHRRRARHRRRDKGRRQALIWCVCAAASVLLAVGAGVMSSRLAKSPAVVPQPVTDRSITQRADEVGISGQVDKTGDPTSSAQWNKYEIRPDDGALLWMSPTEGDGPKLKHVAPGALLIVLIRPAQLLESEYGQQVVQALGPTWKTTRQTLEALLGHALTEIDQLVVCQCPSDSEPNVSLHVRLLEQRSIDQLFERWNEPAPLKYRDVDYFGNGDWYYWIPGESPGNEFVVGQQAMVQELIDQGDSPPLVRRELRQLLQQSDADRHMTLVVAPDFVNPSALLNSNGIQKWRDLLVWLAGDQSKAISIGMQFGDPFYGELRARGETNGDGPELAVKLRNRMTELPEKIEERLAQVYPSQYWRRIALRFPEMLRYLERFTRSGVEDGQAVLNVVLPGQAAHNIAFAAEMLWDSADSGPPTDAVNKRDSERPSPENLDQLLSRRMDLSFGQKSLEFAIAELTEDIRETFSGLSFPVEIQIVGSDLQLSGITAQSADFKVRGTRADDR